MVDSISLIDQFYTIDIRIKIGRVAQAQQKYQSHCVQFVQFNPNKINVFWTGRHTNKQEMEKIKRNDSTKSCFTIFICRRKTINTAQKREKKIIGNKPWGNQNQRVKEKKSANIKMSLKRRVNANTFVSVCTKANTIHLISFDSISGRLRENYSNPFVFYLGWQSRRRC